MSACLEWKPEPWRPNTSKFENRTKTGQTNGFRGHGSPNRPCHPDRPRGPYRTSVGPPATGIPSPWPVWPEGCESAWVMAR